MNEARASWGAMLVVAAAVGLAGWWGWRAVEMIEQEAQVSREAAVEATAIGAGAVVWEALGGEGPGGRLAAQAAAGREALRQTWHLPAALGGPLAAGAVVWVASLDYA